MELIRLLVCLIIGFFIIPGIMLIFDLFSTTMMSPLKFGVMFSTELFYIVGMILIICLINPIKSENNFKP